MKTVLNQKMETLQKSLSKEQIREGLLPIGKVIEIIQTAQSEIITDIDTHFKIVMIEGHARQRLLHDVGGMVTRTDERRYWFLYQFVNQCLGNNEIQNIVKIHYGAHYGKIRSQLYNYGKIIGDLNFYLNHFEPKRHLTKEDTQDPYYHAVFRAQEKIPPLFPVLDNIYYLICRYTNIGQYTVSSQVISQHLAEKTRVNYDESGRRERPDMQPEG